MPENPGKPAQPPSAAQPTRIGASRRVDELDRRIIKMLQANGRLSNTEVARALDVTETTVRKRIAHLLDEKLMTIVAVPSPEAAGGCAACGCDCGSVGFPDLSGTGPPFETC